MRGICIWTLLLLCIGWTRVQGAAPDSAYLFAYADSRGQGRSGLCFAWSTDGQSWQPIGDHFGFVRSDYGRWGSEKRMIDPVLYPGKDGHWYCVWYLNPAHDAVARARTVDLISWEPQAYFTAAAAVDEPFWKEAASWFQKRTELPISGRRYGGILHRVSFQLIRALEERQEIVAYRQLRWQETTAGDAQRFKGLQPLMLDLTPAPAHAKKISDKLIGVFFEDINYAADGGLYAELVQNRDFEYDPADKEGRDSSWNSLKAWELKGNEASIYIDTVDALHANNRHYAVLDIKKQGARLVNEGYDGIALKAGERYDCSLFVRSLQTGVKSLLIRLVDKQGKIIAAASVKGISQKWRKHQLVLQAVVTTDAAQLEILPQGEGRIALDMVSLFPQKTFRNRKNGLRADLAESIAALQPKFVRFPGGCVAHGDGLENIYHWKQTIGPLETRKPQRNLWGYHQSAGLGYYEYFQFCEDIGASPLPVVAAGVPCQNSAHHGHALGGQQGGIPLDQMPAYIQDILDLIEWANGPADSKWGKRRAQSGHVQPFHLKYIGIGNEDLISGIFKQRFAMIYKAIKEKHPEITVIGTTGPFFEGSDYEAGWKFADELGLPMVDEHYYVPPGWFIYNQDFYDKYDRTKSGVYLGEYAAHLRGRANNLETALAEAIHLTALERNGDIVKMSSYAPLLAKEGHTQWNPDMIYFNNTEVKLRPGYYVQQLFSRNAGDTYIPAAGHYSNNDEKVRKRVAWSMVYDSSAQQLHVRLVNLLPVPVTVRLKDSLWAGSGAAKFNLSVMQGAPTDQQVRPVTKELPIAAAAETRLSPYSLTVLSIQLKD